MVSLTPNTVTTYLQLAALVIACSSIILHHRSVSKSIRLEEDAAPLSQEEVEAVRLSKELDGVPVKQGHFEHRIRLTRSLLVVLSAAALSMSLAEVAYITADEGTTLTRVLQSEAAWPMLSGSAIWILTLFLAFDTMVGQHHWFMVVTISSLTAVLFMSDVALLVIAQDQQGSQSFLVARLFLSLAASALAITTPSGPRRVRATPQGTKHLARLGSKGRTVLSTLWFTGAFPLIRSAQRKEQLDETDTPLLGSNLSSFLLHVRFSALYRASAARGLPKGSWIPTHTLRTCWPLLRAIGSANKGLLIANQTLCAICGVTFYAPSYVTFRIISYLEEQQRNGKVPTGAERLRFGLPYCLLLGVATLTPALIFGQIFTVNLTWLKNNIRTQLTTAIFAKALRRKDCTTSKSLDEEPEGNGKKQEAGKEGDDDEASAASFASKTQVVNLASVDAERVSNVVFLISFAMPPVEIVVGGFFAIKLLGWGAVIGMCGSILFQPLIFYLGKLFAHFQGKRQATRDRRVTLLNEVFQAIRMIKFNAWESQTSARVKAVREEELKSQTLIFVLETVQSMVFFLSPVIVILVSYAWFTLVEKRPLTPSVAFTAMAVLEEMRFALFHIPEALSEVIQSLVSVKRIQQYLEGEEVDVPKPGAHRCTHETINLRNASIEWPRISRTEKALDSLPPSRAEPAFSLSSISIDFAPNALNLIVGKLGSGKTLLLHALLGEAELVQGTVSCPRSLPSFLGSLDGAKLHEGNWLQPDQSTYVPQTAFLINASLKDNILFGLPLLSDRYQATLDACGLLPDLKLLEDGDETEIGENGIGLSGGQKIRVTLARAVYGRGATVLLDDCLSAVDAHTADHIHKTLLRGPLCANRTVILVTHQVQLVAQSAGKIVMLDGGLVKFEGDPMTFLNSDLYHGLIEDQEEGGGEAAKGVEDALVDVSASEDVTPDTTAPPSPSTAATDIVASIENDTIEPVPSASTLEAKQGTPRKLVQEETRAKGAVLLSVYRRYISAAGGLPFAVVLILLFISTSGFTILTTRWLQYWSSDVLTGSPAHSDLWWLTGWAALWLLGLVLESLKLALLFYGSLRASRLLFINMMDAILHTPLRFHDTVSRGRLLNRFGYDFEEMDSETAEAFERLGGELLTVVVNVFAVTSGGGWPFIVVFALMVPVYVYIGLLYITAARDTKRLYSTTRSPIIGTFSDVVSGVGVIRAFGASQYFFGRLVERIDVNATYAYWNNEVRLWYEQFFSTLSFFLITLAAIIILLNPAVGPAKAGFVFNFLINSHIHLLFLLREYSNVEKKLVSVERIVEYTQLPPEEEKRDDGSVARSAAAPASWPHTGSIEVKELRVRYASQLPDVLKGVSFSIPAGAKVGVVGPTGCGKSTLASSFFRFVEVTSGSISVDGVDISGIPLKDLRSRLQIVPQDPIILSGPLRSSVDVLGEYSDAEVRQALRDVQLLHGGGGGVGAIVSAGEDATPTRNNFEDLQYAISEGGGNLSNGEKQLLCLARAVLRRSKVIIFDEATSSVDFDTDQVIQNTIREAFEASTILTIAHRLRSIVDYDLVIVMDDGKVCEFDSPKALLSDSSSRFYKLCKASGRRELAHLKSVAGVS